MLAAPGILVNNKNLYHDYAPLIWASREGHSEMVTLLLAAPGIPVFQMDEEGKSAMDVAENAVVASRLEEVVAVKRTFGALQLTLAHRGIFRDMAAHLAMHGLADERAKAMARRMHNTWPT